VEKLSGTCVNVRAQFSSIDRSFIFEIIPDIYFSRELVARFENHRVPALIVAGYRSIEACPAPNNDSISQSRLSLERLEMMLVRVAQ
jgi:hypothetical protein